MPICAETSPSCSNLKRLAAEYGRIYAAANTPTMNTRQYAFGFFHTQISDPATREMVSYRVLTLARVARIAPLRER